MALVLLPASVPLISFVFYNELYVMFCLVALFLLLLPDSVRTGSFLYDFLVDRLEL